jgi:hypothetical protein
MNGLLTLLIFVFGCGLLTAVLIAVVWVIASERCSKH